MGGYHSLTPFSPDAAVLRTVAILMLAGATSYAVVEDVLVHRRFVRLALDTKLVLTSMVPLRVLRTLAVLFTERSSAATLGGMEPPPRTRAVAAYLLCNDASLSVLEGELFGPALAEGRTLTVDEALDEALMHAPRLHAVSGSQLGRATDRTADLSPPARAVP